jgi:acyl-CoA thioesterase-1
MQWRIWMLSLVLGLTGFAGQVAAAPRAMVFFGDSLTAGYGLDPAQAYPALIQAKLREASLDYDVINAGISGDTTSGGVARLDWILRRPVDVFVLALGGNDGLRGISVGETRKNLAAILARVHAKYPQAKLVVAGMQLPPNLGAAYVAEFRAIFPDVAREAGATLVPFLLEGVAAQPALNQADMMHPTAAGQQVVANNVWTVLRPLL